MNETLLATFIGGFATIIATVVGALMTRLLDKRPQSLALGAARRAALEGKWRGTVRQNRGPTRSSDIPSWVLKTTTHHI